MDTTVETKARRIPVIQTGHALESLRDSGHSLPTALGEVVDNSIEAKANRINILLEEEVHKGKKRVHRISVIDDGTGMDPETLHNYPVIGYSTRYMRTDTIGKYGVGAKLAALNFGRRIDVWSRTSAKSPWLHVHFDLDEALKDEAQGKEAGVDAPETETVPPEFADKLPSGAGTLVVWSRVDRLEEGRLAASFDELRLELQKELARIFRYFISGGIKIDVNGDELMAHDPLMRLAGSWSDYVLTRHLSGEKRSRSKLADVKHFESILIGEDALPVNGCKAKLTVTLYPPEIVRTRGKGGDPLAKELRVPENQGAISFVRKSREVSYTNVPRILPLGVQDPDRFIGIEVSFSPDLDDYFGIRNVKRGVEPHGQLRDAIREKLKRYIPEARRKIEEIWGAASRETQETIGEHAPLLEAVKEVDMTMPKSRVEEAAPPFVVEEALKELAQDLGKTGADEQAKYVEQLKELPFVLESVDFPGNMFMSTQHLAGKVIIRLNTRHPFYREMWEPLKEIATRDAGSVSGDEAVKAARRTIEALTLLLVAYGKAESMHPTPSDQYGELTQYWGQFLSTLLHKVKNVL